MHSMSSSARANTSAGAAVTARPQIETKATARGQWSIACYRAGWRTRAMKLLTRLSALPGLARVGLAELGARLAAPNLKWDAAWQNLVTDAGLNYLLDAGLSAGTQITTWYIGLMSATPTAAASDTMSSHAGWTEITAYSESVRQTFIDAGVSAKSMSNTASPAVFTINANSTNVGGAFLTSVNTKSGTTGTLYAAGAFTAADKSLDTSDTLSVTCTFTQA